MRMSPERVVIGVALLFVLMQLVIPARSNPPSDPAMHFRATRPPGDAAVAVFDRSCRDCHSHDTTWPLYSRIAPVSWLVAHDVNEGRGEFNLSVFGTYDAQKQKRKLEDACEQVKEGEMPMGIYTLMHSDAKLQPGDVETICTLSTPTTAAP